MDRKLRIAVIFGGCSPEYPVSLESAHSVIVNLDSEKYELILLGITKGGEWYRFFGGASMLEDDTWHTDRSLCIPAVISPDRDLHGVMEFRPNGVRTTRLDAAFPVLHGRFGEDGTVQGLCELAGIPVIGCGTLASALCMDKDRAHKLASLAGVDVPESVTFTGLPSESELQKLTQALAFPVFVKPLRAGSSFGITKVTEPSVLRRAVREALKYDREVIVEEAISGFEVGCAVMGNAGLVTGRPDEIETQGELFDYVEKYNLISSKIHMPARVDAQTELRIQQTAMRIYRALGCRGFARVDMFLEPTGRLVFNEVNTIPGFTSHSRFPNMMRGIGYDFGALLDELVAFGLEV